MEYYKKADDLQFRRVSVKSAAIEPFQEFTDNKVMYNDDVVLELLKADGSTELVHELQKKSCALSKSDTGNGSKVVIGGQVPLARLWVKVDACNYKIPLKLPGDDAGNYVMEMKLRAREYEICGDKYFEAVYRI